MYTDRRDAGKQLAHMLEKYSREDIIVLALPRGGVEVGYEIAAALNAELDVLVVRKLGVPYNPEFGFGAIASYGAKFIDKHTVESLDIPAATIEYIQRTEQEELVRREKTYRRNLPSPAIEGRTVILVDDGIATGGTAMAAIKAVRTLKPAKLILATPVAPLETAALIEDNVDEFICPQRPARFMAISDWYLQFSQTSDETVITLLEKSRTKIKLEK